MDSPLQVQKKETHSRFDRYHHASVTVHALTKRIHRFQVPTAAEGFREAPEPEGIYLNLEADKSMTLATAAA